MTKLGCAIIAAVLASAACKTVQSSALKDDQPSGTAPVDDCSKRGIAFRFDDYALAPTTLEDAPAAATPDGSAQAAAGTGTSSGTGDDGSGGDQAAPGGDQASQGDGSVPQGASLDDDTLSPTDQIPAPTPDQMTATNGTLSPDASGSGSSVITPSQATVRTDCPPPNDAPKAQDGLALGAGTAINAGASFASPFFVKGVETMFGSNLWDRVKDLPFDSDKICQGEKQEVACGPFNVPDVDGKCYSIGLSQYAKSAECQYACGRCVNPLEHLANLHSYLKYMKTAVDGVDLAAKYSPKVKGMVDGSITIVQNLAAALCSWGLSDGKVTVSPADCLNTKIFQADTWAAARAKLNNAVAIGNCASETLGTIRLATDLIMQIAGKADYGYLGDSATEGLLNFGCSALAVAQNCTDVPGALKTALAPVKDALSANPYFAALAATCTLSSAVANQAVCDAARNSCLLQVNSYARPIEIAQAVTAQDGSPSNVRGCCLCQYEGRNWLGVTSSQVECERGLALPQGSKRKDCRYVTVESKTCSLARAVEAFDDASRQVGMGFEEQPLNEVTVDGGRITSVKGQIQPPEPPIFFWEYGVGTVDPKTGAMEWGAPDSYSYNWIVDWSTQRTWFENLAFCSANGYRLPTVGELGYLRADIFAKYPQVTEATTYSISPNDSSPTDPWYYFYGMGGPLNVMQPGYKTHTVCVKRTSG